ncbi:MAG: hypothetical protein AB1640_11790 [bacterium]
MPGWQRSLLEKKSVEDAFAPPAGCSRRSLLPVSLLYLALTVVFTMPVALGLRTRLCGDVGDNYAFLWWLEWFGRAVTELHVSPFHSDQIGHPLGASFQLNPTTLFNAVLSLPLQRVFPIVAAYNVIVLFSFWASAVAMYLLAFHLIGRRLPSFVAGFLFAFSSYRFAHALGHLTTISSEWLPLYLLFLIRSLREPGKKNLVAAAICLVLNGLSCWYYLVYGFLFTAFVAVYFSVPWGGKESARVLRTAFLISCAAAVVLSPLVVGMVAEAVRGGHEAGHAPEQYPADLLSFFIPSFTSTWGMLFQPVWAHFRANPIEGATFIGYSVLLLLLWGVPKAPRAARSFWLGALLLFWVLSLGPFLNVAGRALPLPLPYLLLHRGLPFFSLAGVPARFHVVTTACLAVLAGYAVKALQERATHEAGRKGRLRFAAAGLALLCALDHLHVPVFTARHFVSPFYSCLGEDPRDYALIDLTLRGKALFCTTVHGKKLVGGYVARPSPRYQELIRSSDVLRTVFSGEMTGPGKGGAAADQAREELARLGVELLIYPRPPELGPVCERIRRALGRQVACEDGAGEGGPLSEVRATGGAAETWIRSVEAAWPDAGWPDRMRLALGLRFVLASHPELLPTDDPVAAIGRSERIVRDLWHFPVTYEDDGIRVYRVPPPGEQQ